MKRLADVLAVGLLAGIGLAIAVGFVIEALHGNPVAIGTLGAIPVWSAIWWLFLRDGGRWA